MSASSRPPAFLFQSIIFLLSLSLLIHLHTSSQIYTTLVSPLVKEKNTTLFSTILNDKYHYILDLDAPYSWYKCNDPPRRPLPCHTDICHLALPYAVQPCKNTTCTNHCLVTPINPVTKACVADKLTYSEFSLYYTDGANPIKNCKVSDDLFISCAPVSFLVGLPRRAIGVASFSWSTMSHFNQLTLDPSRDPERKFALCMPNTPREKGTVFIGPGPYYIQTSTKKNLDISANLSYTTLFKYPRKLGYYISVRGIWVRSPGLQHAIMPLLGFDSQGNGGVKVSTTVPYTTFRTDVYNSVFPSIRAATSGIERADSVDGFEICLKIKVSDWRNEIWLVPNIEFMLSSSKTWKIYGPNVLKQVSKDVACVAFKDGGRDYEYGIVIGSYQMENNLVLFDVVGKRIGFGETLLMRNATCGNFNFTLANGD